MPYGATQCPLVRKHTSFSALSCPVVNLLAAGFSVFARGTSNVGQTSFTYNIAELQVLVPVTVNVGSEKGCLQSL